MEREIKSKEVAASVQIISRTRKSLKALKYAIEKGTFTAGMVDDLLKMDKLQKSISKHVNSSISFYGRTKI